MKVVLLSYRKKRGSNHDYFIRPAIHRVRMLARAAQRSLKHFPSTEAAIPVGEREDWHSKYEDLKSKIAWHRDGVGPDVPVLQPRYDALRAEIERPNAEVVRLKEELERERKQ